MIGIIDYGMGNLSSVKNALDFIGTDSVISEDMDVLSKCDGLILPGVGAFPDAAKKLNETGLDTFVKDYVKTRPLLGICLGMQLLFDKSYEFGECGGLSLVKGEVVKLTAYENDPSYLIPHMGWNSLSFTESGKASPLLSQIKEGDFVYFVHSFKADKMNDSDLLAFSEYGERIPALVTDGKNVFGAQFHPEKSEKVGLSILKSFCSLVSVQR